ncbi:hypothetical protein MNB_SV-6-1421 [hydrothermal vent metagenome]|uniref:Uncharacterized protein n=1 Tax=hydrothermal vent metagenome TaxID=652676 RepID=A0A1W1BLV3_9ZZZZ
MYMGNAVESGETKSIFLNPTERLENNSSLLIFDGAGETL